MTDSKSTDDDGPVADETVTTTARLRGLLRMARENAGLSQARAAQRVHISQGWWKQIENATQPTVGLSLLLRMFDAVCVLPQHLRSAGLEDLADKLDERHRIMGDAAPFDHPLDRFLWGAPADPATKHALIAYARTLREVRAPAAASPVADAILATRRQNGGAPRQLRELPTKITAIPESQTGG